MTKDSSGNVDRSEALLLVDLLQMVGTSVKECLREALTTLLRLDIQLLQVNANERSITHRLAVYLERELDQEGRLQVDCEYNRQMDDPKRLRGLREAGMREEVTTSDTDAWTIYPDIVVHVRGRNEMNLLAVEVKKNHHGVESVRLDRIKLEGLRSPPYGYQESALVIIDQETPSAVIEWSDMSTETIHP